jgi:hypothetical protein
MTREEAEQLIAEREARERDAFARRVVAVPSLTPAQVLKYGQAYAEGYEWMRGELLYAALEAS